MKNWKNHTKETLLLKPRSFHKKELFQLFQFCLTVGRGRHDYLEPSDATHPKDASSELKEKYGEGEVTEEICPNCSKKFQCYSKGIFESENGMLQYFCDDMILILLKK